MRSAHHRKCNPDLSIPHLTHVNSKQIYDNCRLLLVVMMNPDPEMDTVIQGMDIAKVRS